MATLNSPVEEENTAENKRLQRFNSICRKKVGISKLIRFDKHSHEGIYWAQGSCKFGDYAESDTDITS